MPSQEETKKTLKEWADIDGFRILDPDGFDRKDPMLWERLFTRQEFNKGLIYCTIEKVSDIDV